MRDPWENLLGRDRRQGLGDSERVCLRSSDERAGIGADTVELVATRVGQLDMIVDNEDDGERRKGGKWLICAHVNRGNLTEQWDDSVTALSCST